VNILLMISAKTEIAEFIPPYLENFSKGDAETRMVGGGFRHKAAIVIQLKLGEYSEN
jgi:hypothetical protein